MIKGTTYLRVTRDWTQMIDKNEMDAPLYVSNPSGIPVEFFLSTQYVANSQPSTVNARTHVVGGSIGSVRVNEQYLYARALTDSDDNFVSIMITDGSGADISIEDQATRIDKLLEQVVKLTARVNEDELVYHRDRFSYYKLMRFVVRQGMTMEKFTATLGTNLTNLFTRIMSAEMLLIKHASYFESTKRRMDEIDELLKELEQGDIVQSVAKILSDLIKIQEALAQSIPDKEETEEIVADALAPTIKSLAGLNNTIAKLTTKASTDDINVARDELISLYGVDHPDLVPVINSLADFLIRLTTSISDEIENPDVKE